MSAMSEQRQRVFEALAADREELRAELVAVILDCIAATSTEVTAVAWHDLCEAIDRRNSLRDGFLEPDQIDENLRRGDYDAAMDLCDSWVKEALLPLLHGFGAAHACRTCLRIRPASQVRMMLAGSRGLCVGHTIENRGHITKATA